MGIILLEIMHASMKTLLKCWKNEYSTCLTDFSEKNRNLKFIFVTWLDFFMHKTHFIEFDLCLTQEQKIFANGMRKINLVMFFGILPINNIICGVSTLFYIVSVKMV